MLTNVSLVAHEEVEVELELLNLSQALLNRHLAVVHQGILPLDLQVL